MGPMRSRAINSHFASASLTWEEKYKNLGSGLLINGCSLKPKYLTIASISIVGGNFRIVWQQSRQFVKRLVKVAPTIASWGKSDGNFPPYWQSCLLSLPYQNAHCQQRVG